MCLCPKNNFGMGSATTIFKKDSFDSLCKNYQNDVFTDKFNQTEKNYIRYKSQALIVIQIRQISSECIQVR